MSADDQSDPRDTRPSLLLRIRDSGDGAAWREFESLYGPIIRAYCRRRGLQEADAADVGQDVLARVSRAIASFEYSPSRGRFRDWLGTVTRNRITRFFEVKGREGASAEGGQAARLEDIAEDPEWSAEFHARILEAAMARIEPNFEPTTWSAFRRIWSGDERAPAVALDLGLTIDAVYAAKSRVLRRLRDEVLALADDLPWVLTRD